MTPAPISVERLRELLDKATPGPWDEGTGNFVTLAACHPDNRELIAAAVNALPALLQQLAEREADLEREQGVREDAQRQLRVALNDLHDMRWMYAQELKRAEAAERAREEACGLLDRVQNGIGTQRLNLCESGNQWLGRDIAAFLAASGGDRG